MEGVNAPSELSSNCARLLVANRSLRKTVPQFRMLMSVVVAALSMGSVSSVVTAFSGQKSSASADRLSTVFSSARKPRRLRKNTTSRIFLLTNEGASVTVSSPTPRSA